jgi:hypothetical protein
MKPRKPSRPHRVLVSLLYGQLSCAEREADGSVRGDAVAYARAVGLRTHAFRAALAELKQLGFLDRLIWHRTWFLAKPRLPHQMGWLVGPRPDSAAPAAGAPLAHAVATAPEVIDV